MGKRIFLSDPVSISAAEIERAAALILAGELVAFPTETVYGLGANALDAAAVERIYAAKGRPAGSPLIVHVDSVEMARRVVRDWPGEAARLARRFWPGPLTLVLPKSPEIPDRVTAGLDTVGIRMPAHAIASALIRASGVPIAAPSANRFAELSPTTTAHVRESLGDRVALILDGGPTTVGLESTVLSLVGGKAVLLRPGMVSQAEIEELIGPVEGGRGEDETPHPAPGMHPKHYSPRTPLYLVRGGKLPVKGRGAYLFFERAAKCARPIAMPSQPHAYAAALYATLHDADAEGWDWIAVEAPPEDARWAAIADRLKRAAAR
jgi:L-threonylcarbamoyladenylate synthase